MKKLITALFALSLAATPALARPGGDDHHRGPPMLNPERIERMADDLGLAPQALDKIKERLHAAKKEHVQLRAELDAAKLELHRLLDQDAPDKAAVLRQVDAVGQKKQAIEKLKIAALLDVRSMLTPEQRQKLRTLQEDRGRGKGKKGKGKDRGDDDDRGPGRRHDRPQR